MNKKTKVLADSKTSATSKPNFEKQNYSLKNADISELQSMKNQYIEEIYSTTNENHKEIFKRLINRLEDRQVNIVEDYLWRNGSQPMNSSIGNIL